MRSDFRIIPFFGQRLSNKIIMKKKNPIIIRLEYCIAAPLFFLIRRLPARSAFALSTLIAYIAYYADKKHRDRTIQHLLHANIANNRQEANKIAKQVFVNVCKVPVEAFRAKYILTEENIREHLVYTGQGKDIIARDFLDSDDPTPMIAITPHFGCWEIIGIVYTLLTKKPMISVMRPFDNPLIGKYIVENRITEKHTLCSKDGALKPLLSALKKKQSIGLLADQHASSKEGVETIFFGHPARTHASPAILHLRTGVPIVVAGLKRKNNNFQYELILEGPFSVTPTENKEADIKKTAQIYTTAIENIVKQCPEQWLWTHRRWLDINRKNRNSSHRC